MDEDKNSALISYVEKNPRVQILYFYNSPFNKSINKPFILMLFIMRGI